MIRRLAAIPGITKHQTGDNEGRLDFEPGLDYWAQLPR
jgi:hypothetical protein